MGLQADDPRSQFEQIADDIRDQVTSGALPPGGRLPSVRDLMVHYDVSTQTVQNALRILKAEGLVHSVAGRGVFITGPASNLGDDGDAPSAQYVRVMDQLDKIAAEMARVDERLNALEAERAARSPSTSTAARPRSRTT
jgi:GntR family transcriptional regulator